MAREHLSVEMCHFALNAGHKFNGKDVYVVIVHKYGFTNKDLSAEHLPI